MFVGGHKRPRNKAQFRVDRRKKQYRSEKRQGVLVMRERGPGGRTLTFLAKEEKDAIPYIQRHLVEHSSLYVDGDMSFETLNAHYDVHVVVHDQEFARWADGRSINTNLAESYNSRLRRAEVGIHHRIAGRHLLDYTDEMAWRETFRRETARQLFTRLLTTALKAPPDKRWRTYWGDKYKDAGT